MSQDYALIKQGIVGDVIVADADLIASAAFAASIAGKWDRAVPLRGAAGIGWGWENGMFTAPAASADPADTRPTIVTESLAVAGPEGAHTIVADNMLEVRTVVGATLQIGVRIDQPGGGLYPLNESFDMPITSVDGRVRPFRVMFESGRATFAVTLPEPRIWNVTEDAINSGLPPHAHMRFDGLRVIVAEM